MILAAILLSVMALQGAAAETVTLQPARDNAMLINPGKGWVQYYGTDKYTKDYISVGYTRWARSVLEPKEGQFNWKEIDDFIQQFKRHGKKTAFGVMSVSTGLGQYVTPQWVFDAGAVPLAVPDESSPTGQQIIPKTWDDPVFLRKMKTFIQALGKRYDGHADIAFLDIRSYGNWGEGHIGMLKAPGIILTPPENLKNSYLLPYIEAFPHTQLIVPWGHDSYNAVYDWAVSKGAGIRRDGILKPFGGLLLLEGLHRRLKISPGRLCRSRGRERDRTERQRGNAVGPVKQFVRAAIPVFPGDVRDGLGRGGRCQLERDRIS